MTALHPHHPIAILRRWRMSSPRIATLVLFGTFAVCGAIATAWFAGEGTISTIFQRLNQLQTNPPMWIEAPMMVGQYLLVWTVVLMLIVLAVMQISPKPRTWSRILVVGILLILASRYLLWRSLSTLNLSTPLNGIFSIGLFAMELLLLSGGIIQLSLLLRIRDRRSEADRLAIDVLNRTFAPTSTLR